MGSPGATATSATFGIYRRLVGARIRADWQYRLSFALVVTAQALAVTLDLGAIVVLFTHVRALAGWTWPEALLLYGASAVSFGLADLFVGTADKANWFIREGHFDRLLIRPLGTLGQLACDEFALRRVGKLIQPVVVLVVALATVRVAWTPARVVAVPVLVVSGTVLFGGLWVVAGSAAFWTLESQLANTFVYGSGYLTQYPLDVLTGWLRRAVLLLPVAFVNYRPVSWVLGRPGGTLLPSPAVAAAAALAAGWSWRTGVRHYRSTGS